ncbi:autotransporter domain-containing protein [Methylorubrum populi]|uniref:Autotransporter domain-containing protein n=1 Tax=Methylorubrum rhodesianum TaxID=29427 RepID=A0ABU9Z6J2_9HYPH|nr:autotransporter domain-containing protein [Methylorubrum rhodesianum]MBK3402140.1 autotransporter domain-containing protein [Methylorubrum rhodesianum]MBY0140226.1 autotransporter domain-containing protein [Methylorubrum populi]
MRFADSVSLAALLVGALGAPAAHAQSANISGASANAINLLGPYLDLNATPAGRDTLQRNLDKAVELNTAASPARRSLAMSDKSLFISTAASFSPAGLTGFGAGASLAGGLPAQAAINGIVPQQPVGGLGARLGAIYVQGIAGGDAGPLGAVQRMLASAFAYDGTNNAVAKDYFANGAARNPPVRPAGYVPVPAAAPAGFGLPRAHGLPNTTDSVYDLAYGVTNRGPGQNVYGSSRPFQVAPDRIRIFDPSAVAGLETNAAFPSGHAGYGFLYGTLLAMAVPQSYQGMLARSAEYGESRVVLGVHYPLDVIGGRALASYDIAQALTNPLYLNNATTTGTALDMPSLFTQASTQIQGYLAAQCGTTVAACAQSAANTAGNPYLVTEANAALYRQRLTYGLPTLSFAQGPREAAPAGGPDAAILLAPVYGGSSTAAQRIAPAGGLAASLQTGTINQILVNTQTEALAAFYGTPLSYWTRIDLYAASTYFGNVTGTLQLDPRDRIATDVTVGNAGTLIADGAIGGRAAAASGGVLGGAGTVGGLLAQSGGTVSPGGGQGGSLGTLTVAGDARFAPGSTLRIETATNGASDRVAVTGQAVLGGTVALAPLAGVVNPTGRYSILTASAVSGRFDGVSGPGYAFLASGLDYNTGRTVDLTIARNGTPFAAFGRTRNEAAAAAGLDAAAGSALNDRVVGLTAAQAPGAFAGLTGDVHASTTSAAFEAASFVRETLLDRLRRGGTPAMSGTVPATYTADLPGRSAPMAVATLDPRVFGLWGQGFGSFGDARGDGNAAGLTRQTAGFALGADLRLENGFRIGVVGGYSRTNLDTDGRRQTGEIESAFGGVYGGTEFGPVALRLGAVYADNSLRTRRSVTLPGLSETETARYGGRTIQGFGELGYRFALSAPGAVLSPNTPAPLSYIEPFIGGAYVHIGQDRFLEAGGAAALRGLGRDNDVGTATAGLRAQTLLDLGSGAPVAAHGLVGYRRAFGDVIPTALLAFQGGASFVSAGLPIDRDVLVASAGLDLRLSASTTLGLAYTGQVGARAQDHAVKGGFTYRW